MIKIMSRYQLSICKKCNCILKGIKSKQFSKSRQVLCGTYNNTTAPSKVFGSSIEVKRQPEVPLKLKLKDKASYMAVQALTQTI